MLKDPSIFSSGRVFWTGLERHGPNPKDFCQTKTLAEKTSLQTWSEKCQKTDLTDDLPFCDENSSFRGEVYAETLSRPSINEEYIFTLSNFWNEGEAACVCVQRYGFKP